MYNCKPSGNIRLGRRFTEEEKNDSSFLKIIANLPMCESDHYILMRFGGYCQDCGKVWELF